MFYLNIFLNCDYVALILFCLKGMRMVRGPSVVTPSNNNNYFYVVTKGVFSRIHFEARHIFSVHDDVGFSIIKLVAIVIFHKRQSAMKPPSKQKKPL